MATGLDIPMVSDRVAQKNLDDLMQRMITVKTKLRLLRVEWDSRKAVFAVHFPEGAEVVDQMMEEMDRVLNL